MHENGLRNYRDETFLRPDVAFEYLSIALKKYFLILQRQLTTMFYDAAN